MNSTSEFALLVDKLARRGYPRTKLLSEVHDEILYEYKRLYPGKPQNVAVVVSEETGEIKLLSNHEDVTPAEFIPLSEKIAKDLLVKKLKSDKEK